MLKTLVHVYLILRGCIVFYFRLFRIEWHCLILISHAGCLHNELLIVNTVHFFLEESLNENVEIEEINLYSGNNYLLTNWMRDLS